MPYTKEQYEIDKAIVENAPDCTDEFFIYNHTVNYIDNHENGHQFKIWDDEDNEWVFSELVGGWEYIRGRRSLQDIRDKIELYEQLAESERLRYKTIEAWSNHLDKAQAKIDKLENKKAAN